KSRERQPHELQQFTLFIRVFPHLLYPLLSSSRQGKNCLAAPWQPDLLLLGLPGGAVAAGAHVSDGARQLLPRACHRQEQPSQALAGGGTSLQFSAACVV